MRVLVLGCYREPSGWGETAAGCVRALHEAGADVACRAVQFTPNCPADPLCAELERKSFPGGADATLTHAPPYVFGRVAGGGLHAGAFFSETWPLPAAWARGCATQDLLLTPHDDPRSLGGDPRIGRPNRFLAVARDPALYAQESVEPACLTRAKGAGRFVVYAVGEWCRRKNFAGLLRAYFSAFWPDEPVCLLLKTGVAGQSPEDSRRRVLGEIEAVRAGCKLAHTPPVEVETGRLDWPGLLGLHRGADMFALPSRGEGWCLPAFDAAACGRAIAMPDWGGPRAYLSADSAWLLPTRPDPAFAEGDCHADLFTGRRFWADPCLGSLAHAMRQAYSRPDLRAAKAALNAGLAERFRPAAVGRDLLGTLEAALAGV
jgi:glycosyltransferase involved in cell wall biosynthesis